MSGIFGVASKSSCMEELYYGTDYQSHLGTEFAGLAIQGNKLHRAIHRLSHGQFKNLFNEFYHGFSGEMGVGVISDSDAQPIVVESKFGTYALVTCGLISNRDELTRRLISEGVTFSEVEEGRVNQTEIIAKVIAQGKDIVGGIERVFDRVQGSVSLLLLTAQGVYAACDPAGRLPLAIGSGDGRTAAASESCAFYNLGLKLTKYVQSGEVVFFDSEGLKPASERRKGGKTCAFLWIYTGYPASCYDGISVETVRERCGRALARKDKVQADVVSGVPDSGTGHAIGYAMESRLPFRRPLVKYSPGYGRSYTPPSQEVRDRIAKMKLIPIEDICRGNRLVVCEDSIVRGTQLKNLTLQKLWDAGAAEVHIRVACPPLMFPCIYALSTRSGGELAARRAIADMEGGDVKDVNPYLDPSSDAYKRMVGWIRKDLNCSSLIYLSLQEMVDAIGLDKCKLCTYCWDGDAGEES